jgi:hypothetical protein
MSRYGDGHFDRVLAPEGEILSFASPSHRDVVNVENAGAFFRKRKYPKLRRPYAACFLRSVVFVGGCQKGLLSLWQRAASLPHPYRAVPDKNDGARRGIRE